MQTFDKNDRLIETKQLENEDEMMQAIHAAMMDKQVQHFSVGKMPSKGDVVMVNGLRFDCIFVDQVHGIFKMKLQRTK